MFAQLELLDEPFHVAHVVFDDVARLGIPRRLAVPAHVHGNHSIPRREVWRDVIERVRVAIEAVDENQRRPCPAPIEVVEPEAVDRDEPVGRLRTPERLRRLRRGERRSRQQHDDKNQTHYLS